jgi:hypothetical protein
MVLLERCNAFAHRQSGRMDGGPAPEYSGRMTAAARRRFIALSAAYAVALQAVLASFVLLAMSVRPAQEVCTPAGDGQSLPPGDACLFCPLTCTDNAFAGVAPPFHFAAMAAPAMRPACGGAPASTCSTPRLLPPARAPPAPQRRDLFASLANPSRHLSAKSTSSLSSYEDTL